MARRGRPYHHGDLRRGLLDAALAVIDAEGPEACTLREVARRAGVSHAAPYRHFADREALLAAVAEEGFRALAAATASPPGARALDRLVTGGQAYVRFALEHPSRFRVMFGRPLDRARHPTLAAASEAAFAGLVRGVEAAQAEGTVRPGDSREMARVAWALLHGVAVLGVAGQFAVVAPAALAARAMGTLVEGLAPRGAR